MSGKTSTFTIHHDRCHPDKWTALDLIAFANFVRSGSLASAATLSRLGMQLVMSEHHQPLGGEIEAIGWAQPGDDPPEIFVELRDVADYADPEIFSVYRIYRGPAQHVVVVPTDEGDELEVKATLEEAQKLAASLASAEPVF